ncbi:enoyl-CoA hydratase/isomerase family protein [Pseudomonadota bacterium]
MTENLVRTDHSGGITQLVLARPPVNALNPEFLGEIDVQLSEIESSADVRAIVITSNLPVFSAGMDLKEARKFSVEEQTAVVDGLNGTFCRLYGIKKPVIVAVNRAAIAGGLFFVLAADYTIAGKGARFGLTEVRAGVEFPVTPLEIACAELTPSASRRLMLGGRNLEADAAREMGIVDEVVDPSGLIARAMDVAKDYAEIPAMAYSRVKMQLRGKVIRKLTDAIESQSDPTRNGWFTEETLGAMNALMAEATRKA